ncbi:MAG: sigma-54-dependent Fis family transcriptional regulator [Saprospiraceae bacterium]|nr:sigma-54-dependent Fis family transcriptional regulator [Saprospiraceae bacterium]
MRVFVVDDERIIRVTLVDELRDAGYTVNEFSSANAAMAQLSELEPDIVITDLSMPGMDGIEFLKRIKSFNSEIQVIIITAYSTVSTAVNAMKLGAYDYVTKPFESDDIILTVARVKELCNIKDENAYLRTQIQSKFDMSSFVGSNENILNLFDHIKILANTNTTILITGETGTGKELLTNIIHFNSDRKNKPLIKVSCAILNKEVFESELFGHEKGAFTGAESIRKGRFELANGGTLYLDDIDDMPLNLQVKLLRALEEREIERVGGMQSIKIDIRVIASTKADLKEKVAKGEFREDLYYRLGVFPLNIPPLRERKEDLKPLIKHFINTFSGKNEITIQDEALNCLMNYSFPGNTREVKNLIERLVLLARNNVITYELIPLDIRVGNKSVVCTNIENRTLTEILTEVEQNAIIKALEISGGNKSKAAEILGIPASTLKSKLPRLFQDSNKDGFSE